MPTKSKKPVAKKPTRKGKGKPTGTTGKGKGGKRKPLAKPLRGKRKPKRANTLPTPQNPANSVLGGLNGLDGVCGSKAGRRRTRLYYVIAVEPGKDRRVRKEILRRRAIESMEDCIGRVICPIETKEVLLEQQGVEIATGFDVDPNVAKQTALARAWQEYECSLPGDTSPDYDTIPKYDPEGYRTRIFPKKATEKGKQGNGWTWVVKRMESSRRMVTNRVLKYPGYVIIHMDYAEDTFHLITKIRHVWGFLPIPIPLSAKPTESELEARESWMPTALESEEAAELLIQQANENKKVKGTKGLNFKVGDTVTIKDGAFLNMAGKVLAIAGTERDSDVTVQVRLLSRDIPVQVKVWQVN